MRTFYKSLILNSLDFRVRLIKILIYNVTELEISSHLTRKPCKEHGFYLNFGKVPRLWWYLVTHRGVRDDPVDGAASAVPGADVRSNGCDAKYILSLYSSTYLPRNLESLIEKKTQTQFWTDLLTYPINTHTQKKQRYSTTTQLNKIYFPVTC